MQLSELKAIVTGGASGMGRAFTVELARAGASVMIADVDEAKMAATVVAAADLPGTVHTRLVDVTQEDQVTSLVHAAHETMGGLNGLVNNAGIFRDGLLVKKDRDTGAVKRLSLDKWNAVIAVDLTGPFLCAREFAAKVIETDTPASVIVNISSVARHGNQGQSNYSAAKAGLVADTKLWGRRAGALRHSRRVPWRLASSTRPILQGMRPEVLEGMLRAGSAASCCTTPRRSSRR